MLPGYRDILFVAQRRPERQPRLHFLWRVEASEQVRRSTKAGASTPATHVGRWHPGHTRRRSTKAGASTPATPDQSADRCRVPDSLNEGRSVNPGYTYPPWYDMQNCHCAQRRPERQPRLHLQAVHVQVHRHVRRSTKAGASTPATPAQTCMCATPTIALNEGRSVNPGYTYSSIHSLDLACTAQRKPERQPRLHRSASNRRSSRRSSFNEGRSVNPGYTFRNVDQPTPPSTAQRRPERQPRLHTPSAVPPPPAKFAQRRPERQPRLHP